MPMTLRVKSHRGYRTGSKGLLGRLSVFGFDLIRIGYDIVLSFSRLVASASHDRELVGSSASILLFIFSEAFQKQSRLGPSYHWD